MLQKTARFYFGTHSKFCVVGGGTAGISVVAQLKNQSGVIDSDIRVFEPNKKHYYQPAWSMVAGNIYDAKDTVKLTRDVFPKKVPISELAVQKIDPKKNTIYTEDGDSHTYDNLIIATGLTYNYEAIKGSKEALDDPNCPVGSAYTKEYAQKFKDILKNFESGDLVMHEAPLPIKCPGAPQKVCFLAEDELRKTGKRERTTINSYMAKGVIFGVPKYAAKLTELYKEKNINVHINSKVVEIDGKNRFIVYENTQTGVKSQQRFDALHMVPHQQAPAFIKESGLGDEAGFVNVDQGTLQHKEYKNVWGLGDSSSCPTSKTAAAIFSQTPVLVQHLMAQLNNTPGEFEKYDGYTSCPLLIGDKKLILAEFKYGGVVDETFPIDQGNPKGYFYAIKKTVFPWAYWQLVPRGLWHGRRNVLPNLPFYSLFSGK